MLRIVIFIVYLKITIQMLIRTYKKSISKKFAIRIRYTAWDLSRPFSDYVYEYSFVNFSGRCVKSVASRCTDPFL